MKQATQKQLAYISKLIGNTYESEYGKLTTRTASDLIDAIKVYKNPVFFGSRAVDDAGLAHAYENLCHAEIAAFGHTFASH